MSKIVVSTTFQNNFSGVYYIENMSINFDIVVQRTPNLLILILILDDSIHQTLIGVLITKRKIQFMIHIANKPIV